jgi:hypothetical protein
MVIEKPFEIFINKLDFSYNKNLLELLLMNKKQHIEY